MNMIEWALAWHDEIRNRHLTEDVSVVYHGGVVPGLKASVISPDTTLSGQGVRIKTDSVLFLFTSTEVTGIEFKRGVKILREFDDSTYVVIVDKNVPAYFNDANRKVLVVPTKLQCF